MPDRPPAVLVVDDDFGTRQIVDWALRSSGHRVGLASSGAEGMTLARSGKFDLLLVDFQLPDVLGTNLARAIRAELGPMPFVLISGWLKTEVTVEAMKLGASNVLEKPIAVEALAGIVASALENSGGYDATRPRSAAERWAAHVLKACESEGDLKTVRDWAACAGVSTTSLRENCQLLHMQPRDARDFARVLRALIKSRVHNCAPEALLDVSDRRTLTTLLQRGGIVTTTPAGALSVSEFLATQRFISSDNEALSILRTLIGTTLRATS